MPEWLLRREFESAKAGCSSLTKRETGCACGDRAMRPSAVCGGARSAWLMPGPQEGECAIEDTRGDVDGGWWCGAARANLLGAVCGATGGPLAPGGSAVHAVYVAAPMGSSL